MNMDGARFALSFIAALALATGLPWALDTYLDAWLAQVFPTVFSRALPFLMLSVALAVGGALLPYIGGKRSPGRGRTAILGAILGGALAFNIASQLTLAATPTVIAVFPETSRVGALAVTLPIITAIGATLGAQSLVSRGVLAIARSIGDHIGILLAVSAIAGGWLGFTITQASLTAAFHPEMFILTLLSGCGLLIGVALGLSLSAPIGAVARSFASVRP